VALTLLPRVTIRSRNLEYLTVISDTFLVALALFRAGLDQVHLPLVFFPHASPGRSRTRPARMIAGTTALAAFYLVLTWRGITGARKRWSRSSCACRSCTSSSVLRTPGAAGPSRTGRRRAVEVEKQELETFLEVTKAATSTLELDKVLLRDRPADRHVGGGAAVFDPDRRRGVRDLYVLASSDNPAISGLRIELKKYPKSCARSRPTVRS